MVENIGLSTNRTLNPNYQIVNTTPEEVSDNNRTYCKQRFNFTAMKDKPYTEPELKRNETHESRNPKLTKSQRVLAEHWFIEYKYTDLSLNLVNQRVKNSKGMNKFTDAKLKEKNAISELESLKSLLEEGWNPFNEESNINLRKTIVSITIPESINLYKNFLLEENLRRKTLQTYESKLKYFGEYYPLLKVNQVTNQKISDFLKFQRTDKKWSSKTYNAAHQIINALFTYLLNANYVTENPVKGVVRLKGNTTPSDLHKVIKDEHFKLIRDYLAINDKFTEFFVTAIYYTCIRPKELRQLKLKMVDLSNNKIVVPSEISKNKRTGTIPITPMFKEYLKQFNLDSFPKENYLFSSASSIGGSDKVGENTPYYRFMSCLKKLNLDGEGYTLYSVKHTSNVARYLGGWSLAEIMAVNRHGSISQTETYLRELNKFIEFNDKEVPL
ncbi:MAG: site-specific integrase [Flavobacterium sp.]|nr:MAG: site-specific integrase [Flavobacterium sp.]